MIYIALLRGINVGGHTVKMDHLCSLFSELHFANVRSYIQTGNIFFESDETDTGILRKKIEEHLQEKLGYAVPTCLRTISELENTIASNPFKTLELTEETRFSVTFLAEPTSVKLEIPSFTPDKAYELIAMAPSELFIVWHLQNGRPGNSYDKLSKDIDTKGTTRFWHTTAKILAAAKK